MANQVHSARRRNQQVYIIDTNVLYHFLKGKAIGFDQLRHDGERDLQRKLQGFFDHEEIVIPFMVLVEFFGQFFHRTIHLQNYSQWYRLRRAALNPIFSRIFPAPGAGMSNIRIAAEAPRMGILNMAYNEIPAGVRQQLEDHYSRMNREHRQGEPKFLDGIDAVLLDEAVRIAASVAPRPCTLLSTDRVLKYAVEHVRDKAKTDARFPKNLRYFSPWWLKD